MEKGSEVKQPRAYSYLSAHHKTGDHETAAGQTEACKNITRSHSETTRVTRWPGTYLVRRDVLVGVVQVHIFGETALTHLDGSGSGHQAVRVGDVSLSEYAEHFPAVVAHLHVFREGREQTDGQAGPSFKHGQFVNSSDGESRRRRLVSFVEQTGEVQPVARHHSTAAQ